MSDEESKIKHSKRLHKEEAAILKQQKIAIQHGADKFEVRDEPHRFAKHHAQDCGIPGCVFCSSPRKIFKEKTKQEKSFDQQKLHDE
jgi:hypothetical protein